MRYITLILMLFSTLFATGAYADPPNRVGRISYVQGIVTYSPAGTNYKTWLPAKINRPLIAGDRLWVDANSRAEIQIGTATLRLRDDTSLRIINLNDLIAQFDVSQGTFAMNVSQYSKGHTYEVDTPHLAFQATQAGNYRLDVDDHSTTITLRSGKGVVYTKTATYTLKAPASYRFAGRSLYHITLVAQDNFDKWVTQRQTHVTKSHSARYVSTTIIGYEDLDTYGSWRNVRDYGYVWVPRNVGHNWAPYRHGHWSYIPPWGWTWIDDQPWGFSTSHYGRWAYYNNTWVWVPGRRTAQATYAPALVAFIGGNNFQISLSVGGGNGIAWFPLGPRDVYIPPYQVSQQYFTNINSNNTIINNTQINNVYNNRTVNNYTYQQTPAAVTAVPTQVFVESEHTGQAAVPVTESEIKEAPASTAPAVEPEKKPEETADKDAPKPSEEALDKVPVAVTPPPTNEDGSVAVVTPAPAETVPEKAPEETTVDPAAITTQPAPVAPDQPAVVETEKAAADAKVEADQKAAEKDMADKAAAEKAEAEKAAAAKAAAEKLEAEKAAAEKAAAEKAEMEKAAAAAKEQVEAERAAAAKAEADRAVEAAKAEADRESAARAEAERAAAEQKAEAERAAAERDQAEKAAAAARAEAEHAAAAKAEADRAAEAAQNAREAQAAAEREAAERAQAEHQAAAAAEREAERAQAEQQAAAQREAERAQREAERAQIEQQAAAQREAERAQAEQQAAAQREAERAQAEQQAAAQREAERAQAEQQAAAQREAEKAAAAATTVP